MEIRRDGVVIMRRRRMQLLHCLTGSSSMGEPVPPQRPKRCQSVEINRLRRMERCIGALRQVINHGSLSLRLDSHQS